MLLIKSASGILSPVWAGLQINFILLLRYISVALTIQYSIQNSIRISHVAGDEDMQYVIWLYEMAKMG